MPWVVTLKIVDCASTSTLLPGARISSPLLNPPGFVTTDANGEAIIFDNFDVWEWVALAISKSGTGGSPGDPGYHPGYINKNFVIDNSMDGSTQTVCLTEAPVPDMTSCFTGDTRITLADGTEKPIATVRVGDLVLGRRGQRNRVTAIERPRLGDRKLYALNGGAPFVTAEHPFLTETGWSAIDPDATRKESPLLLVGRLGVNSVVIRLQECAVTVSASGTEESVEPILDAISLVRLDERHADPETELYNLLLDGDHTYFANGFIVHNKCFIVSATTGSPESWEVNTLRALRDRVSATSRLSAQLIDAVYAEYEQFSPEIAAELYRDEAVRGAVLARIVRPLLTWYRLAGILALERNDENACRMAAQAVLDACPQNGDGTLIVGLLESLRDGTTLPPFMPPMLRELAPRVAGFRFASWAILEPLIRTWRSVADRLDVADEVAQWLAGAPFDLLGRPDDADSLDAELRVLAGFLAFAPGRRAEFGERLLSAWPDAAEALARAGLIHQPTRIEE